MGPSLSVCILVPDRFSGLAATIASCQTVARDFLLLHTGEIEGLGQFTDHYPVRAFAIPATSFSKQFWQLIGEKTSGEWLLWLNAGERLALASAAKLPAVIQAGHDGCFLELTAEPTAQPEDADPALKIKNASLRLLRRNLVSFTTDERSAVADGSPPYLICSDLQIIRPPGLGLSALGEAPLYEPALPGTPAPVWQKYREGIHAWQNGDPQTARECFAQTRCQLTADHGLTPLLTCNIALTYLAQQQWRSAAAELETALPTDADYPLFHYLKGICCWRQFDFDAAKHHWEECLASEATVLKQSEHQALTAGDSNVFALALYRMGQLAYLEDHQEQAGRYWLQALTLNPEYPNPFVAWLRLQQATGHQPADSLQTLRNSLPEIPCAARVNRLRLMKAWFEPAILLNEIETAGVAMLEQPDAWFQAVLLKAECLIRLKRFRILEAFLTFETAVLQNRESSRKRQLNPTDKWRINQLLTYHCLGRWSQAPPVTVGDLIPKMPVPQQVRRDLYALNHYITANTTPPGDTQLAPPTVAVFQEITEAATELGLAGCIVKIQTFIKEQTAQTSVKTALAIGKALFRAGDADGAFPYLQEAYSQKSCDAAGLVFLGRLYRRQNLYAEAQNCYEAANALQPSRQTYLEQNCSYQEEILFYADWGLTLQPEADHLLTKRKEALQCLNFYRRLLAISE